MKVVVPKETTTSSKKVLLPLLEDEEDLYKLDKTNSVYYNLRTVPADADSPTYKYQARILQGTEPIRAVLKWKLDAIKCCTGLNATTLATKQPILETTMRAGPVALFHQSLLAQATVAMEQAIEAEPDAAAKRATATVRDALGRSRAHPKHGPGWQCSWASSTTVEGLWPTGRSSLSWTGAMASS